MENIVARSRGSSPVQKSREIHIGSIMVDVAAKRILKDGKPVELSPKEYSLIEYLANHRGTVIDRDRLYEAVWGDFEPSFETLSTVNVHVSRVRQKLGADIIRTVKLEGFVIDTTP